VNVLPDIFIEKVNRAQQDLVIFAVMRNESLRLHAWLRHYRDIGVRQFAIVDNGSTDATWDILAAQDDVVFTRIDGGYAQSNFGVDWAHEFHDRISPGTWVLFADCDELLVYRGWPQSPLSAVLDKVRRQNRNAIYAFMLDMYPRGPLETAWLEEDSDIFQVSPCFDLDYIFRFRPQKPWGKTGAALEIVGGPRVRILSSFEKEARSTWVDYWLCGQMDRILPHVPDSLVATVVRSMPRQMPCLSKVPLVLTGSGFRYTNAHGGTGGHLHGENMVLCHFKFLADFARRVNEEAARKEHYRRGTEYILYADTIRRRGHLDLSYERSTEFKGAEQLVELGLIRDITPWCAQAPSPALIEAAARKRPERVPDGLAS